MSKSHPVVPALSPMYSRRIGGRAGLWSNIEVLEADWPDGDSLTKSAKLEELLQLPGRIRHLLPDRR
jgi:hypothetical protein